jgi:hypothetical protein
MVISKATSVYVVMVVVLVGGLWLILSMGATLLPPTDLAGKWELAGPDGTQELSVEQSGKFVDLAMNGWTANLKIKHDGIQNPMLEPRVAVAGVAKGGIVMNGSGETVTFDDLTPNDACTIRFEGKVAGIFQAHRVFRAFH